MKKFSPAALDGQDLSKMAFKILRSREHVLFLGGGEGGYIYISIDHTLCCHLIDQIVVNKHGFLNTFYPSLKAAMIKCGSINHEIEYFNPVETLLFYLKKGWVRQNSIFAIRFSPRPHQPGPLPRSG